MSRDANTAFAVTVVDEWERAGIADVCVAPGSRNAPLTLALVSGSPGIRSAGEREARVAEDERRAQDLERDGIDLFMERWLEQRLFETLPREAAMLEERKRANTVHRLTHQLRALGPGVQEPLWDRLPELTMPVLLAAGSYDRAYSSIARRMADAIGPRAQVVILERAGHAVQLEQPQALAHELASWADGSGAE